MNKYLLAYDKWNSTRDLAIKDICAQISHPSEFLETIQQMTTRAFPELDKVL